MNNYLILITNKGSSVLSSLHDFYTFIMRPILWALNHPSTMVGYAIAFSLGCLFTITLMFGMLSLIFYFLPNYSQTQKSSYEKARITTNSDLNSSENSPLRDDPHLSKSGWVCISHDVLPEQILYDHVFSSIEENNSQKRNNIAGKLIKGIRIHYDLLLESSGNYERYTMISQSESVTLESRGTIAAMSGTLTAAYSKTYNVGSFLLARFLGDQETSLPLDDSIENPSFLFPNGVEDVAPKPLVSWKNYYAVLRQKTLYLYSNPNQSECLQILLVSNFKVRMHPHDLADMEMYQRTKPVHLAARKEFETLFFGNSPKNYYMYSPTKSDKEDWFFLLRRASRLPEFADAGAISAFYEELNPMKAYIEAMKALIQNISPSSHPSTNTTDEIHSNHATTSQALPPESVAWLNALVGRAFVAIHSNQYIKEWMIHRLSTAYTFATDADNTSFLGDIVIQDLSVGNSLPVISNPRLLSLSVEQDMKIEFDIDYTGGIRIEAGTVATLSVAAWNRYIRPLTVPLVVALKIKRFSARVLLKIKRFWESNRVWFGFYRQPELKLEIEVEPIISNKLIKFSLVNQVIEHRIKQALEEFVILPNMDDLSFWPWEDIVGASPLGTSDTESSLHSEDDMEDETCSLNSLWDEKYKAQHLPSEQEGALEDAIYRDEQSRDSRSKQARRRRREPSSHESGQDDEDIMAHHLMVPEARAALAGEVVESSLRRRSRSVTDLNPRPRELRLLTERQERPASLYAPDLKFREQLSQTSASQLPDHRDANIPDFSPTVPHLSSTDYNSDTSFASQKDGSLHSPSLDVAYHHTNETNETSFQGPISSNDQEAGLSTIPSTPLRKEASSYNDNNDEYQSTNAVSNTENQPVSNSNSPKYVEYLGNAAYGLGRIVRQYGLDQKAKTVANKVASLSKPALDYASNTTSAYTEYVQATAVAVGLSAIDKLGLRPDTNEAHELIDPAPLDENNDRGQSSQSFVPRRSIRERDAYISSSDDEQDSIPSVHGSRSSLSSPSKRNSVTTGQRSLRTKRSTVFSVLGVSVSTSPPSVPTNSSPTRNLSLGRENMTQDTTDPLFLRRPRRAQSSRISSRRLFESEWNASNQSLATDSSDDNISVRKSRGTSSVRHSIDDLALRAQTHDIHRSFEENLDKKSD